MTEARPPESEPRATPPGPAAVAAVPGQSSASAFAASFAPADTVCAGIMLALVVGVIFTALDAANKHLTVGYAVVQVVWARYFFQMLLVPLIVGRVDIRTVVRSGNPLLQVVRSLFLVCASGAMVTALHFIPMAEASIIAKTGPLIVTALAIPLLGERVGARRWAAVVVGFVGVLIIIRPGFGTAHWAMFLPLFSTTCFALYQITTRKLAAVDPPVTTFLYSGVVGAVLLSAIVPFFWTAPDAAGWALMAGVGLASGFGHYLLIHAYRRAQASVLAPFSYVSIVWSVAFGYLVFGDFPSDTTFIGAAIIVASGGFVFYRESIVKKQPRDD